MTLAECVHHLLLARLFQSLVDRVQIFLRRGFEIVPIARIGSLLAEVIQHLVRHQRLVNALVAEHVVLVQKHVALPELLGGFGNPREEEGHALADHGELQLLNRDILFLFPIVEKEIRIGVAREQLVCADEKRQKQHQNRADHRQNLLIVRRCPRNCHGKQQNRSHCKNNQSDPQNDRQNFFPVDLTRRPGSFRSFCCFRHFHFQHPLRLDT